jgi:uncharacterized metal-binding protein YceD (DUF177 family)
LRDLEQGATTLKLHLDDDFFSALNTDEIKRGDLTCDVVVYRTEDVFELKFHTEGTIHIACSLCLGDMEQSISTDDALAVKFGDEYSEDDDLVTVAEDEGILDVVWFIYEFIELNIPIRHVHAPGKCDSAMMKMLEEYSAARSGANSEESVDPRWAALAKLKNKD